MFFFLKFKCVALGFTCEGPETLKQVVLNWILEYEANGPLHYAESVPKCLLF